MHLQLCFIDLVSIFRLDEQ